MFHTVFSQMNSFWKRVDKSTDAKVENHLPNRYWPGTEECAHT